MQTWRVEFNLKTKKKGATSIVDIVYTTEVVKTAACSPQRPREHNLELWDLRVTVQ